MFLDFGLGILSAVFLSRIFNMPLTPEFIWGGILFSVLMDADFFIHFLRGGNNKNVHKHREILHYPLIYIPIGTIILSFYDFSWTMLFALCSFLHFVHDSIGIGWGVRWLYPFTKNQYTFFYRYQPPHREKFPLLWMHIWKHDEIDALAEKYGDPDWFKNIYLRLHPYGLFELLVFVLAVIVLLLLI